MPRKDAPKTGRGKRNYIAYAALRQAGVTKSQAEKELGLSDGYGATMEKRKGKKFGLDDPRLAKLSHSLVKSVLSGKPRVEDKTLIIQGETLVVPQNVYPTFANQLQAAQMVAERYDPVTPAAPLTQVNLAVVLQEAHRALKAQVMDVPTPSGSGDDGQ